LLDVISSFSKIMGLNINTSSVTQKYRLTCYCLHKVLP
jgi:hypothetical protein